MGLFGLGKKPTTFGLDIGSSAIKVVELVPGQGRARAQVLRHGRPSARRRSAEGTIREPGVVTDAIRECVQKAGDHRHRRGDLGLGPRGHRQARPAAQGHAPRSSPTPSSSRPSTTSPSPSTTSSSTTRWSASRPTPCRWSWSRPRRSRCSSTSRSWSRPGSRRVVVDLDAFAIQNQFELSHPGRRHRGGGAHRHRRQRS